MQTPHVPSNATTRLQFVSVHYGDGQRSFWLAADATLAELAARIGDMDDDHDGPPLLIDIRIGVPGGSLSPPPTAH